MDRKSALLAFLVLLFLAPTAQALTFTVNIAVDDADSHDVNPGNGICADSFGDCTLRAAIQESNATAALDVIQFADGLAGQTVVIDGAQGPLPPITNQVFILGETIDGYNLGATLLRNAPPQFTIDGTELSFANEHGLLFSGEGAADSIVSALSIVNFPGDGIQAAFDADRLTIHRNYIGVFPDRSSGGNGGNGFRASFSEQHLIGKDRNAGGTDFTGLGNVFQSNGQSGIWLESSSDNEVRGNLVGISPSGTGDRGNGAYGIRISGNSNDVGDRIGNSRAGNFLAGNNLGGIFITGNNNLVYANSLGKGETGGYITSEGHGIHVFGSGNFIGNANNLGNQVNEHDGSGIRLGEQGGSGGDNSFVIGNQLGTAGNISPVLRSGNNRGINVANGDANVITDNIVLNSTSYGLLVNGDDNVLLRNQVGYVIGFTGSPSAEPNFTGLFLQGGNNIVGSSGNPNYFGGNLDEGIRVVGFGSQVHFNYIGVHSNNMPIGNGSNGINNFSVNQSITNNVIGDNGGVGVHLGEMSGGLVEDNWIGTAPDGSNLGNGGSGITMINGAEGFDIRDNEIAFNNGNGISAVGFSTQNVGIFRNTMHHNTGIGIDLGTTGLDGVTPNDPGDADLGANRLLNTPEILQASIDSSATPPTLTLSYRVDTTTDNALYPLTVRVYWTDLDEPVQGRHSFFFDPGYTTPNQVLTSVLTTFPEGIENGWVTATTQDSAGNTSEFSVRVQLEDIPAGLIFRDGFED